MPSSPGRWTAAKTGGSWIPSPRAMLSRVFTRLVGRRRRSTIALVTLAILLSLYVSATHYSDMEDLARGYGKHEGGVVKPQPPSSGQQSPAESDSPQQKPLVLPPISYGTNARPAFKEDTTFIADLPSQHIPYFSDSDAGTSTGSSKAKRLIIIGDVHGQLAALKKLLKKISFDNKNGDHLIFVGDLITKGPDSPGVVQLAMDLGASAVRGNHEDRALLLYATDNKNSYPKDKLEKAVEDSLAVAHQLTDEQREWLSSLPVVLRIGRIPGSGFSPAPWNAGDILVVHGGLVPALPVHKQDPWGVMNMRSLKYPIDETFRKSVRKALEKVNKAKADKLNKPIEAENKKEEELAKAEGRKPNLKPKVNAEGVSDEQVEKEMERLRAVDPARSDVNEDYFIAVPNDARDGEPWSHAWNRVQNGIENPTERSVVIYGHDAKAGLQVDLNVDIFAKPLNIPPSPRNKDRKKPPVVDDEDELRDPDIKKEAALRQKKTKKIGKGVRYAFGLDSGAGKGDKLTALIIETSANTGGGVVVHHSVQSVRV
ncbi:Metallo-dependent phosphatase-like protein [Rhypophila decipiens]|uniref:Metallo-dependent phosphatase-like protein n=1 Tax=Rhypophila decipiens TaxID=261697 RepID=A0AAN6XY20_9PEZI|nr:Metallo-dependent phosphatase-like protein [Rhypophila decipiens]